MKPSVNVLYFPGTNCHAETLRMFARVGADARLLFLSDVLAGTERLDGADILCLPGGFAYGDHLGAGTVGGSMLAVKLEKQFAAVRERPLLCICNGFQTAVRVGVFGDEVALRVNECGTFRNVPDQPHVVVGDNPSPWLDGLAGRTLRFPCAHGEGRFVSTSTASWRPALVYPEGANPDGSEGGVAGITSPDGLAFGLMNHPERSQDPEVALAFAANGVRAVTG